MNSVSFTGKQEVVYALTKTAEHARYAEMYKLASRGPHPVDKSMQHAIHYSQAYAYADMAVIDSCFNNTIQNMSKQDVAKLGLVPQILNNGISNPLKVFSDAVLTALKNHKKLNPNIIKQFLNKVSL